jgi:hypothetical protein
MIRTLFVSAFLLSNVAAFSTLFGRPKLTTSAASCRNENQQSPFRPLPLFMGRAAAVRAATKSKTDGKKAKVNAVFGKRIIMAVKLGGSPDPNANRSLRDIIKLAKSNNVPVEVSYNDDSLGDSARRYPPSQPICAPCERTSTVPSSVRQKETLGTFPNLRLKPTDLVVPPLSLMFFPIMRTERTRMSSQESTREKERSRSQDRSCSCMTERARWKYP